jgi:hypothetical protein
VSEGEEQVARELADELGKLKVEDVLIGALIQISSIGYRRLGLTPETKDDRDLGQARLAIETLRAVTPVLENVVPPDLVRDFNQSVANLQLAYAQATQDASPAEPDTTPRQAPGHGENGPADEGDPGDKGA